MLASIGKMPCSAIIPMKKIYSFALLSMIVSADIAHATPITIGGLSSNDDWSTSVISDYANGIEYVRFDQMNRSLNYGATVAAIEPGGQYYGWQMAREAVAKGFIDALLGVNNCTTSPYVVYGCAGSNSMSAVEYGQLTGGYIYDRFGSTGFAYHTDEPGDVTRIIGLFRPAPRVDPVVAFDVGPALDALTYDRATAYYYQNPSPFLLYRYIATLEVSEPSGMVLFVTAFFGLFAARQRTLLMRARLVKARSS